MLIRQITEGQRNLARQAFAHPVILTTGGQVNIARHLERKGWGAVENGASGETIFRLNQAGADAVHSFHNGGISHD